MLQPKKERFRKMFRWRSNLHWDTKAWSTLAFWSYWLKAITAIEISARQIESARKAINNHLKRQWKLWIRIFPHKPVSKKAAEVPMWSWKWSVEVYVAVVCPGRVIFELEWIPEDVARGAFEKAMYKLPCKTKFITKTFI